MWREESAIILSGFLYLESNAITQYLLLNTNGEFDQLSSDNSRIEDLIDIDDVDFIMIYEQQHLAKYFSQMFP